MHKSACKQTAVKFQEQILGQIYLNQTPQIVSFIPRPGGEFSLNLVLSKLAGLEKKFLSLGSSLPPSKSSVCSSRAVRIKFSLSSWAAIWSKLDSSPVASGWQTVSFSTIDDSLSSYPSSISSSIKSSKKGLALGAAILDGHVINGLSGYITILSTFSKRTLEMIWWTRLLARVVGSCSPWSCTGIKNLKTSLGFLFARKFHQRNIIIKKLTKCVN